MKGGRMKDILELLSPEHIEVDYTDEQLLGMGFSPEQIQNLGKLTTAAASEMFADTSTPGENDARLEAQIEEFQESVKEKPQPGGGSQRRF
jgi:hypothetical protein